MSTAERLSPQELLDLNHSVLSLLIPLVKEAARNHKRYGTEETRRLHLTACLVARGAIELMEQGSDTLIEDWLFPRGRHAPSEGPR